MSYAGDLTPTQAWTLLSGDPEAVLIDVRTREEWAFVGTPDTSGLGRPPLFVQWSTLAGGPDPAGFVEQVSAQVDEGAPLVLLCRSGQRSVAAAQTLTSAGYGPAYNVLDGFEGNVDAQGHRGGSGWRSDGLPWRQQ